MRLQISEVFFVATVADVFQIGAAAEHAVRSTQYDDPHRGIARERERRTPQLARRTDVERVEPFGAIDSDHPGAAVDRRSDMFNRHCAHSA